MKPTIDDSRWPIVSVQYPEELSLSDIDAYCVDLRHLGRRGPYVVVADIRKLSSASSTALHRKRLGDQVFEMSQAGMLIGEAVVIESAITRGVFTAYQWATARAKHPSKAFATVEAALAWARTIVAQQHQRTMLEAGNAR